jgi:hypothetical protein
MFTIAFFTPRRAETATHLFSAANVTALVAADLNAPIGSLIAAAGESAVEHEIFSANTPEFISAARRVLVFPSDDEGMICELATAPGKQKVVVLLAADKRL